uniref:TauD domain-containing protein n=1 Tax=Macrostomum lignano TaxID=282301 RepID=A0A1I8H788_9PLAT
LMKSDSSLLQFLNDMEAFGLTVVEGAPIAGAEGLRAVTDLCNRVAFPMETNYGTTFTVKSKLNPSNLAYTPARLGLHVDLPFYKDPPGIQLLHCLAQSDNITGGENFFSDGFHAANLLKVANPEAYKMLTTRLVDFYDYGTDHLADFHMLCRQRVIRGASQSSSPRAPQPGRATKGRQHQASSTQRQHQGRQPQGGPAGQGAQHEGAFSSTINQSIAPTRAPAGRRKGPAPSTSFGSYQGRQHQIQLLHCLAQSDNITGGENFFSDGFHAANLLKVANPEAYKMLTTRLVDFYDYGTDHLADFHMLCRQRVISLTSDGEYEMICYNNQVRDTYLNMPAYQVQLFYDALKAFDTLLHGKQCSVFTKLKEGDIVTFDNRRVLHGRNSYTVHGTAERHLEGAYLRWDEVYSRIRRLEESVRSRQP